MVKQTKARRAGGSLSATLPKEMVDRLHLEGGDSVFPVETERGLLLDPAPLSDQPQVHIQFDRVADLD